MGLCVGGLLRNYGAIGVSGTVGYSFYCPGCEDNHGVPVVSVGGGPKWTFNGNEARPTFRPSLLVRSGHFTLGAEQRKAKGEKIECWCTYYAARPGEPVDYRCLRCHSYITDGAIQFLGD